MRRILTSAAYTCSFSAEVEKYLRSLAVAMLVLCLITTVVAQSSQGEIIPDRGFHPAASYALGNIETINTTNGNVMLNIPLAALPPGRGSSPGFQLVLSYNSKIWNGEPDRVENPNNPNQMMDVVWLVRGDQGGWKYNLERYNWHLYNRNSGNVFFPPPDCRHFNIWKMKVTFPDGSTREFRPYGFDDQCNDNYFTVQPAAGRSYFSTDGTYTRLDFGATTADWTLSFPDGTRVTNQNGLQRTTDRNGNYTEIQDVANYNGTGHPATIVTDQLGRTIVVEKATGEDYVHVTGFNGATVTTTVKWGSTFVKKMYRAGNHFQYDVNINNWGINGVKEIILPTQLGSNLKFQFGYNGWPTTGNTTPSVGWGELNSVTLPSGAVATYQYERDNESGSGIQANWILKNSPTRKDLNYSLEYDGSTSAAPTETWLYFISDGFSQVTGPDGGITKEYFGDIDGGQWNAGLVHKTERPDGSVVDRVWAQNRPFSPPGVTIHSTVGVNPFVEKESTSIPNAGGTLVKTSTKEFRRDKNGNITQIKEYDWVPFGTAPTSANLKRMTTRVYHSTTPDASDSTTNDPDSYEKTSAPRLLNALASVELGNGSQTISRSEFFYDNVLTTGNVTIQKNWDSTKGGYSNPLGAGNSISISHQYDSFGNRTLTTDARGNSMKYTFGTVGSVSGLYATEVVKAFGTSVQQTELTEYDFYTGLAKKTTDFENNIVNETDYDALGRQIETRTANNVAEVKTVTRTEYSAANRRVIIRGDLNTPYDGKFVTVRHLDQMGRVRLVRQLEDASQDATDETVGIKVQTRFFVTAGNTYELVSNPYRAATSAAAGGESTMGWARTKKDLGGQVVELQTFGGTSLPGPWGSNTTGTGTLATQYDANFTTITEQTGAQNPRSRRMVLDGLGRLIRYDEADGNYSLGTTDAPTQPTSYTYDPAGNLLTVTQGGQTRSFTYSSLSRQLTSSNPENGTVSYQYDNNGNLKVKTDARPVTITYGDYDALNRPTTRSYSDGTPTVTYSYDTSSVPYSRGRLTSISTSASTYNFTSYDALGRVKGASITIGAQTYTVSYTYDLVGNIKTVTYPSTRTVTNSFDLAGRLNSVAGNLGTGGPERNYVTGLTYLANGQIAQEQLATSIPIYNKMFYNSRGQLGEIRASTTPNDSSWNRGAIINHYSDNCGGACVGVAMPDNYGNLRKQEIKIPYDDQSSTSDTFLQVYEYDSLNRLQSVRENKSGGATQWQQAYTYDRFGNRSINAGSTFGGVNAMQASVVPNTVTNRLYAPGETEQNHPLFNYDNAGNQIKDYYSVAGINFDRTFDAENRMTTSTAAGSFGTQNSTYTYDGKGQRVRRNINGTETWQIYGVGGELLAEYAANSPAANPLREYGYRTGRVLVIASGGVSAPAPSALTAAPASGGTQVSLSWSAAPGAVNYRVERKAAAGSFVLATTTSSTSTTDTGVSAGNAYLYRVCAATASGTCASSYSNIALGAAINFPTDPTIISFLDDPTGQTVTTAKAAHITELRTAVNAVRNLAGLSNATWTNITIAPGVTINNEDVTDLRDRLGEALTALGIQIVAYEDAVLNGAPNGTLIKKIHITQLRQQATGGIGGAGGSGPVLDLRWLVTDQLGTPRMIFSESGALNAVSRHDYLPFGEELLAPTGGRTSQQGYGSVDNVRQKFTGKERDNESSLDYFLARYYSSMQGRFITVDPENAGSRPSEPQSWNAYSYAGGNPVTFTDPDGREYLLCDQNGRNCVRMSDEDFWRGRRESKKEGYKFTGSGDFFESGQVIGPDGQVMYTYVQISIDDPVREAIYAIRQAVDPIPKATVQFFMLSAILGSGGGVIAYYAPAAILYTPGVLHNLSVTGSTVAITLLSKVNNPALRNWIHMLYRATARVGSGSTADAIRYERATGHLLSKAGHSIKGQEAINGLEKLIRSGKLNPQEVNVARWLIDDLKDALK